MTLTPEQHRLISNFGIACFCREGGEPHESATGTCKHANWRPPPRAVDEAVEEPEPEGCAVCETETDDPLERCPDCDTTYHESCGHECAEE